MHLLETEFFNFLLAKSVNPKGNQPWIFIGRTDAEAESPVLWQYNGKGPDVGKDWRQKEKEVAENKMVRWHHWLSGHESEQSPGDSEGQGSLVCCNLWVAKSRTRLGVWTATTFHLNDLLKKILGQTY